MENYKSRVYTDRPDYADFDSPAKFNAIMSIIGGIFGFSWKKVLIGAAAVFGILWFRKYLKERKQKAKAEVIQELTEEDFEDVEENKNDEN